MIEYKKEELILSVNNVSLAYDDKPILKDINMQVHNVTRPGMTQGQIVAICGRSGCGKTSLFKLLSGYNNLMQATLKLVWISMMLKLEKWV